MVTRLRRRVGRFSGAWGWLTANSKMPLTSSGWPSRMAGRKRQSAISCKGAIGPFPVVGFERLKVLGLAVGADGEAHAQGRVAGLIRVRGDFAFDEFGSFHVRGEAEVEPRGLACVGFVHDAEVEFDMGGRREGLALLGGGLEAQGFDRADGPLIEAESSAAEDLDILRRAAFVYDEAHDDGGIHARAAGLFAVLRFGSGDDARRAGGPGLGKQESGCEGGDEAGCLGHVPSGGAAGGSWRTRADLEVCPTLSR